MKIGLVGPSYQEYSLPFDAQRSINLYPVFDKEGKEVAALYGTPGKSLFGTVGLGPIRGEYAAANGRSFAVSGAGLYEIFQDGTSTLRGALDQSQGIVSIAENGIQLAICDGRSLYIFTYSSNAYQKVTDADLPVCGTVCFIGGYFVVNKVGTGQFNISALYDGLSWGALDFATAESSPDPLLRVYNAVGQLWLLGTQTTEIWTVTGDSVFPFQRISGANMDTGTLAAHTAVAVDNSIFWLGRDDKGSGIVYRANGFTPSRISNDAVELSIQRATDSANIRAFSYQEDGHVFYFLTGGGLETSWVYDISTQLWHERAYLNPEGEFEQDLACCGMFAFGRQLVGDRTNGNIYTLSLDNYSDNESPLCRERIYTHLSDENKRTRYSSLDIDFETGVGLQSGQGSDPQVLFRLSTDGARTWSTEYSRSIGAAGEYRKRVAFRRLGIAHVSMTFRIRVTDPVRVAIIGSYLN